MVDGERAARRRAADRLRHGRHLDRRLALCRRLRADQRERSSPGCGCARRCWRSTPSRRAAARSAALTAALPGRARQRRRACPGPACYRRGGPLTVTDCNVVLGKISAEHFPARVRPRRRPADRSPAASRARCEEIADESSARPASGWRRRDRRGLRRHRGRQYGQRDQADLDRARPRRHPLHAACFGGAGRPACLPGRRRARHGAGDDPPARRRASAPTAWAWPTWSSSGSEPGCGRSARTVRTVLAELEGAARQDCVAQGFELEQIVLHRRAALRYEGSDTALEVALAAPRAMRAAFEAAHRRRFGFVAPSRAGGRDADRRGGRQRGAIGRRPAQPPGARRGADRPPAELDGSIDRDDLARRPGDRRPGPDPRPLRDHRRRAGLAGGATPTMRPHPHPHRAARSAATPIGTEVDPVMLEIFNNLFMAIAEEMGVALQNTASSVNIKERLDFSCALFDARGRADRQCAAHPGPSRLDGRLHPHDHRGARARRATGAASGAATSMCSTPPIAAAPTCPTSP